MSEIIQSAKPSSFKDKDKPTEVRLSNIIAVKAVSDAIRSSLGPKGMDKMIITSNGTTIVSNDGATILKHMSVMHPCAKMLVELSMAQDVEAGDGTTSVVVLAGSILEASEGLLDKGIHPTIISEAFRKAGRKAAELLQEISIPVDMGDRQSLLNNAITSLNSKVVSQHSQKIAGIAVEAFLKVFDSSKTSVNLNDIRIIKKAGGTIEDMELMDGLALNQTVLRPAGSSLLKIEKPVIAIVQFQLSAPKTDMENQIVVEDYRQMDRILKEEREYLLNMCKKIKKTGCNVLLVQKSILRDAVSELALHFLSKLKIMVVKDVEREEVEFIAKTLGCHPIADIQSFDGNRLGHADLIEELSLEGSKLLKITGLKTQHKTVSILCRGTNQVLVDEAERSLHDALCVLRSLGRKNALVCGGGCPEMFASTKIRKFAKTLGGLDSYCYEAFANALEVIPITLAENAGLDPISVVTELRSRHINGDNRSGINVRKGLVSDMLEENVVQPLLVSSLAIELAVETVSMILKVDDMVQSR